MASFNPKTRRVPCAILALALALAPIIPRPAARAQGEGGAALREALARTRGQASLLPYSVDDGGKGTLSGLLGVPAAGPAPLAILLHGRHLEGGQDRTPYYEGLSYLVDALAGQGFLALAIDLNPVYEAPDGDEVDLAVSLLDRHLEALRRANLGERLFPLDLKGKADLGAINFVGHSRGGGMAPLLADYHRIRGRAVRAWVLLAPTSYIGVVSEDGAAVIGSAGYPLPGRGLSLNAGACAPTFVLIPRYDGDVTELSGYSFLLHAMQTSKPEVPVLAAYMHGANHAAFNTRLEGRQDPEVFPGARLAPPDTLRAFAARYTLAALALANFTSFPLSAFIAEDPFTGLQPGSSMTAYLPGARSLLAPNGDSGEAPTARGMEVKRIISSGIPGNARGSGLLAIPGFDGTAGSGVPLWHLSWDKPAGAPEAWFALPPQPAGGRAASHLIVYWAQDATSPRSGGQPLRLELLLSDDTGRTAGLALSARDEPSLLYEAGEARQDPTGRAVFSRPAPLLCKIIPLSAFPGVKPESLRRLGIRGLSDQGALALYDARLFQSPAP